MIGKVLALSGAGIVLSCVCSKEGVFEDVLNNWTAVTTNRVNAVYVYLVVAMGVAGISAWTFYNYDEISHSTKVLSTSTFTLVTTTYIIRSVPYTSGFGRKQMALLAYSAVVGAIMAPIYLVAPDILTDAAWMTLSLQLELATIGIVIPTDWAAQLSGPLYCGLILLDIANLVNFFISKDSWIAMKLLKLDLFCGLLVYSISTIYVTHISVLLNESLRDPEMDDPVLLARMMFSATLNTYLRVASILSIEDNGGPWRRRRIYLRI